MRKGSKVSPETITRMRIAQKKAFSNGRKQWNKGLEGFTNKGSFRTGQVPWNLGIPRTEKEKKNISNSIPKGINHAKWNGGKLINSDGYIEIYRPNRPFASGRKKYVLEHRYIMEQHLGRSLKSNEVVHHINHIKDDNRLENLKVMTFEEHSRQHRLEKLKAPCATT